MKIFLYENKKDVYLTVLKPEKTNEGQPLPAVLICPGGGYRLVGTTEGRPVSDKFTDEGYVAFILNYSIGEDAVFGEKAWEDFAPANDLREALRLIHEKADEFGIDPSEIVLAGFSAGGHLCAGSCLSGFLEKDNLLPKALVLTYPMGGGPDSSGTGKPQPDYDIARMPYSNDPAVKSLPVFTWHAKDDEMVPYTASVNLDARLTEEGIPHVFLLYDHGIHTRPFFDPDWFYKAIEWLKSL
jgi:Esterase/lipase